MLGANDARVPAFRAAFEQANPHDRILQIDVLTGGCERAHAFFLGMLVVDRKGVGERVVGHAWQTTQESFDPSDSDRAIDVDL